MTAEKEVWGHTFTPEMRQIHSRLIHMAAELVRGAAVPDWSDHRFYRSTPMGERREMLKALRDADEALRVMGIELRKIADSLPKTEPVHPFP